MIDQVGYFNVHLSLVITILTSVLQSLQPMDLTVYLLLRTLLQSVANSAHLRKHMEDRYKYSKHANWVSSLLCRLFETAPPLILEVLVSGTRVQTRTVFISRLQYVAA